MAYPSNRQPTVSTDSVAQDQIRAFVERILRMKEEAKAINDDIREIYAEAKGNGFDKTVLGQVVAYVEKRGKDRAALMEREALFDLYMEAFDGSSSHARARAREIIEEFRPDVVVSDHVDQDGHRLRVIVDPRIAEILGRSDAEPHDPETGELIEDTEPASSEAQVRSERSGEGGEDAPALSADTQSQPGRSEAPRQIEAGLVAKVEDQSTAARKDVRDSTEGIAAPQPLNPEAATTPPAAGRSPVDTHPEPGNGEAGASPAPAPEPAAEGTAHNPIPSAVPGNMQNLHNAPGSIRTERTHTEGVERHQFAVWPEYQGRAHADLVDDVRTNGVREPIVMQGRIILDGWARYLAAREAGVSYPVQEYAGDDPLRDIITLNMASRSLNLVERQSIAKKLTKLAPDRADEIGELLDLQQQREAAQ